ncbi:hypothetical protein ANTRET_LOCUS1441 [Anthophora retusa]
MASNSFGGDTDSSWNAVRLEPNVGESCHRKRSCIQERDRNRECRHLRRSYCPRCDRIKLHHVLKNC